ncbi:glucosamine-6-phosphate deaminase [Salimicrobium halophilum]|uniref:Glucosamine-6-phosphate deaminase n=1 Tax=Salimicrobium halophilum TaxID=86666 RepID=A0A1G8SR75_9BACI|nr:glucosamine-6-phosphate deaminase [Salimicrobium halophilum]SDJ31746.1 glucosamine-6-phosphate deaminase [Salimicrobium halophilum]
MKVKVVKDYEEMSQEAAYFLEDEVKNNPASKLGLATGGTPRGTYHHLVKGYRERGVDYSQVTTFNLDEYVNLPRNHEQSYHTFMEKHLFSHIPFHATYLPNGQAEDLEAECAAYEKLIETEGPPDVQLLGIGENGHIGFNEPGASFGSTTHIAELTDTTRQANARFFSSLEEVPKQAITMGISSILKSKKILLLVSGSAKEAAIERLLTGEVDEGFPASVLYRHADVTLIVDEDAYRKDVDESGG